MEINEINEKFANATDEEINLAKLQNVIPNDWVKPVAEEGKKEEQKDTALDTIIKDKEKGAEETEYEKDNTDYEKISDGRFKNKEDIKKFFEEFEKHKGNSDKLTERETELESYKKRKVIDIENDEDFMSDVYKPYQISKALGIKDNSIINKINDIDNLSDEEKVKLKEIMEEPELKNNIRLLDKTIAKRYNIDKYAINPDYDDLEDSEKQNVDDEVALNLMQLKKDARVFTNEIKEKLKDIKLPETKTAEQLQQEKELQSKEVITKWSEPFKKIVEEVKDFKFSIKDGDNVYDLKMEFTKEEQKDLDQVGENLAKFIIDNGLEMNDNTVKYIRDGYEKEMYIKMRPKIEQFLFERGAESKDEAWRKKWTNPSAKVKSQQRTVEDNLTPQDKALIKLKTTKT